MKKLMKVEGMHCGGCSGRLKRILEALPGVTEAGADHAAGTAYVVAMCPTRPSRRPWRAATSSCSALRTADGKNGERAV